MSRAGLGVALLGLALAAPPSAAERDPPAEGGIHEVLVVLNKADHTAAFVDPFGFEVLKRVPTGTAPHEAAVSRDGRTLYVADYGKAAPGHTLTVIDVPSGEVVRTVDLGRHGRPHGIAVGADGSVWVTAEESRSLVRLSAADLSVAQVFETGQEVTHMVVLTPDGSRAFTANIGSGTVSVADAESGAVRSIETGGGPEGIDLTPDGRELWVAHRSDDNVVVLDAATLERLALLPTGRFPIRVKATADGERVLVSCARSNELMVFDRSTRKAVARIPLGDVPIGILVAPDGRRAFVASAGADQVSVIDLERLEVTGSFSPGREPDGLAWAAWRDQAPAPWPSPAR